MIVLAAGSIEKVPDGTDDHQDDEDGSGYGKRHHHAASEGLAQEGQALLKEGTSLVARRRQARRKEAGAHRGSIKLRLTADGPALDADRGRRQRPTGADKLHRNAAEAARAAFAAVGEEML